MIVRRLVDKVDVVLENFKPGTMERWGLGYEDLRKINPRIIMARVSGWGQDGPYSGKPGFASVAEAVGGLRFVTGYPDSPPVRPNLSLGDTLAGLHAAFGILVAVYHRDVAGNGAGASSRCCTLRISLQCDGGSSSRLRQVRYSPPARGQPAVRDSADRHMAAAVTASTS